MAQQDTELWARARRAQEKLVDQFLQHPQVSLIDIGYAEDPQPGMLSDQVVLRVHVRGPVTRQALNLPDQVDGIPVQVITGDYQLE